MQLMPLSVSVGPNFSDDSYIYLFLFPSTSRPQRENEMSIRCANIALIISNWKNRHSNPFSVS